MRPDLHIASFVGTSSGIDVLLFRIAILISCISLADAACGTFGHGMCIWCGVYAESLCGGALGLVAACSIFAFPYLVYCNSVLL